VDSVVAGVTVTVIPKYLKCDTFSDGLFAIFMS
jgi:hypothetical protein